MVRKRVVARGVKNPVTGEMDMPTPGANLRIDAARLWDSLMEMAKIGPGIAGGNNRQAGTVSEMVRGGGVFDGRRYHGQYVRDAGWN
jgi:hypothetical protein